MNWYSYTRRALPLLRNVAANQSDSSLLSISSLHTYFDNQTDSIEKEVLLLNLMCLRFTICSGLFYCWFFFCFYHLNCTKIELKKTYISVLLIK